MLIKAAFILIEVVMYGLLLWGKFDTRALCYASIVVCLLYSLISINKKTDGIFVCVGLFFCLLADIFLVLLRPADFYTGVALFMVVQMVFLIRIIFIYDDNNVMRLLHLALITILMVTMLNATHTIFGDDTDGLKLLSVAYFAVFAVNTVFAFVHFFKNPLMAVGMLLFLLCDFVIGLQFIDTQIPFATDSFLRSLTHTGINLPWAFYLPGQVMIALGRKRITLQKPSIA